jgi:hypothetical protein
VLVLEVDGEVEDLLVEALRDRQVLLEQRDRGVPPGVS